MLIPIFSNRLVSQLPTLITKRSCLRFLGAGLLALTILLVISTPAFSQEGKDVEVKVGVLAKRGASLCIKRWSATTEFLGDKIPGYFFTLIPLSFDQIVPAVQNEEVDFLLVNSGIFAGLEAKYGVSCIATMETLLAGQESTRFGGVIFTRADNTDIKTLQDLRSKRFIAVDRTSFGGWIMTLREFKLNGFEPKRDFADLTFAGTHDAVVYAVLAGRADAGTVRTDTLERMALEGKISLNDIRVIPFDHTPYSHSVENSIYHQNSRPYPLLISTHLYPEWPFVKLNQTSGKLAKAVASSLYDMPSSSAAAETAHIAGWTIPLQYQSVRECLQELHTWPYEDLGKIYLKDVLKKYWLPLSMAFLMLGASLLIALYINRVNNALYLSEKQLKKAYSKQAVSFDQIIEESLSEIYIFDATNFNFLRVNLSAQKNLGYSREELSLMTPVDLKPELNLQGFKDKIRDLSNNQQQRLTFETIHLRRDGSTYPVEVHLQRSNYHGKQVYVAMILDIADRKKSETERHNLEEKLKQAQKMEAIGTLAGGIAHDFNNILVAIIGFAGLAKLKLRRKKSININSDLEQILKAGERAKELVKQILTFSRKADHKIRPLQPQFIIKEALKMLSSSLPSTVDLKVDITDHCGMIMADPTSIHQIVINLCTNALHSLKDEKGTITVQVTCQKVTKSEICEEGVEPGLFVQLMVSDSGRGIDPELMDRIFEPYFTTKETGKGTGLGLAVIYGIVKDCHGFIKVDSEPGKGTAFHIFFPAHRADAPLSIPDSTEELPTGNEPILVVDDDPCIISFCTTLLDHLGYRVVGVSDSLEALALFQEAPQRFDLLITDQTMPNMTGAELSRKVLAIRPDMPIIMCSGYSSIFNAEDAKALKITNYLSKPVAISTLAEVVRDVLDKAKQGQKNG